jgi:tetratricopeptide (TPR) repeat protein
MNDAQARNEESMTLYERGQFTPALEVFTAAVDACPDEAAAWGGRAQALCALKQYAEAVAAADCALALDVTLGPALDAKACAFAALGRYDEAHAVAALALEPVPESADAWYNLGAILLGLRRDAAAYEALYRSLSLNPARVEAWTCKGIACARLGAYREAVQAFD